MFSRAMTLRMRVGSGGLGGPATLTTFRQALLSAKELDRAAQPVLEPDRRLVAEHPTGRAQIRPGRADVAGARRDELLLDGLAEDASDRVRQLVHRRRRPARDVEGTPAGAG